MERVLSALRPRVYRTQNTEYHVLEERCVAVRDRVTGHFLPDHRALAQRLSGALRFDAAGRMVRGERDPLIGDSLLFHAEGRDVITSPVVSIE